MAMTDLTMLKTTLWVSFFTVYICWAIGAYNRLVRLRHAAQSVSAIAQYNQAIKQFPASWLAAVFAFKPVIQGADKTT
jgi:hypothetical protein